MPTRCGGQTLDEGAQAGPEAETGAISAELWSKPRCQTMPLLVQGRKACASPMTHSFLLGGGTGQR